MVINKETKIHDLELSSNINFVKRLSVETRPYHSEKVIRSHVFFVLSNVSVLIRWQQIAPKFSILSFGGSKVNGKAPRIAETFKDAIKDVVHGGCSNLSHIQVMELVFCKLALFNSLTQRSEILLQKIFCWEENKNVWALLRANRWIRAHSTFVVLSIKARYYFVIKAPC